MNTPNSNRIIDISLRGGTGNDKDWRYALSRLNPTSNSILNTSLLNDCNVDGRVYLLMTSPPKTMKTVNRIKEPVQELLKGNSNTTVGKIASAATTVFDAVNASVIDEGGTASTWQPWMTGVKAWDGSKGGFYFDYEFSFAMGQYGLWNAKEEVVLPILNLIAPALPRSMSNFSMNGPFPTAIQLLSLLVQNFLSDTYSKEGNSNFLGYFENTVDRLKTNIKEDGIFKGVATTAVTEINDVLEDLSNILNDVIQESYKGYTYDVKFGNFVTFNNMIITNGETSFSNEVDQFGYPIAGSVKLTFEGLVPLALNYSDSSLVAIKYGE